MQEEKKSPFAENEEEVLQYWKDKNIFQQTLDKDAPNGNFVFFEGPPTANGKPGIHHVLARVFKDVIPRYKTMNGYHVDRKAGWDTHGLPVELQVEKALGISGKPDIEKYGIAAFNKKCKESVWKFKDEFEQLTERIGYWLDMEHPYITYTNDFIESIWSVIATIHERGFLYKGYKVVPQCPSCGTSLSSHEVAQGYKKVTDTSIYVKFKVKGEENTYILSWTTTPWTLPGNIGLAVGANVIYSKVKKGNEFYIMASDLVPDVLGEEVTIVDSMRGADLVGTEYEPLFPGAVDAGNKKAWYVDTADFVTTTDGTGVVHTAAMYGEDDFQFGLKHDLPLVHTVNENGLYKDSVTKWAGKFVKSKKVEREIIEDLEERNLLLEEKAYEHDYPFCWRCDTPLLYYAKDSWFIEMSKLRTELLAENKKINWEPSYIKDGRFGEWLENVKDWAISRQRYWGSPMPIWECDRCGAFDVLGSIAEVEKKTGALPKDEDGNLDVHRPFIDVLDYACDCGGTKKRVEDVMDVWLDSGTMPLSQYHYPFENRDLIDSGKQYPADFISEAIDQTRGWFYTLLAIAVALGRETPYKNVICLGLIRDKDGKKMSKSRGNIINPHMIIDRYGVDALRMYLFTVNNPGEAKNFDETELKEVLRKVVMLLGNVTNFYQLYAPEKQTYQVPTDETLTNVLDKWIVSSLHVLIKDVSDDLEQYHIFEAARRLTAFIDELSTWYVRRSRDRFKTEGTDKKNAVSVLHYVLFELTKLLAPFTPFMTERMYQKLGGTLDSVHLESWSTFNTAFINNEVAEIMKRVRSIVELSLSARDEAKVKVRQPLQTIEYNGIALPKEYAQIVADELNVKEVVNVTDVRLKAQFQLKENADLKVNVALELTEELKKEGLLRELVRNINNFRKTLKLTVTDVVTLAWQSASDDVQAVFADDHLIDELKKNTALKTVVNEEINVDKKAQKVVTINDQKVWLAIKQD